MRSLNALSAVACVLTCAAPQSAADTLVGAYIGFPQDGAILKHGSTVTFGGCVWGAGDHTVCYRWIFADTMGWEHRAPGQPRRTSAFRGHRA